MNSASIFKKLRFVAAALCAFVSATVSVHAADSRYEFDLGTEIPVIENGNRTSKVYTLVERLGGGGIGIVYLAMISDKADQKAPVKLVALKVRSVDPSLESFRKNSERAQNLLIPNRATQPDANIAKHFIVQKPAQKRILPPNKMGKVEPGELIELELADGDMRKFIDHFALVDGVTEEAEEEILFLRKLRRNAIAFQDGDNSLDQMKNVRDVQKNGVISQVDVVHQDLTADNILRKAPNETEKAKKAREAREARETPEERRNREAREEAEKVPALSLDRRKTRFVPGDHDVMSIPSDMPEGTIAGKPVLIHLEVLKGASPSSASDRFTLGTTHYEMLTGESYRDMIIRVVRKGAPFNDMMNVYSTLLMKNKNILAAADRKLSAIYTHTRYLYQTGKATKRDLALAYMLYHRTVGDLHPTKAEQLAYYKEHFNANQLDAEGVPRFRRVPQIKGRPPAQATYLKRVAEMAAQFRTEEVAGSFKNRTVFGTENIIILSEEPVPPEAQDAIPKKVEMDLPSKKPPAQAAKAASPPAPDDFELNFLTAIEADSPVLREKSKARDANIEAPSQLKLNPLQSPAGLPAESSIFESMGPSVVVDLNESDLFSTKMRREACLITVLERDTSMPHPKKQN